MKEKIFKFFIHFLCWGVFFLIWSKTQIKVIELLFTNMSIIIFVIIYIIPWSEKYFKKEIKREKSEKYTTLYDWTENLDGGENYIRHLFKEEGSKSIPVNMNKIEEAILSETSTSNRIKDLRSMRAYFKAYKDRQSEKVYYKTVGATILSFIIFIIQALIQGRIKNDYLLTLLNINYIWGGIMSFLCIAIYYFFLSHRGENRINLILNVLDENIDEEKDLRKSNKG